MTDDDAFYELEELIREGDHARDAGTFDDALEHYKKSAHGQHGGPRARTREHLYGHRGDEAQARQSAREAESNYEKALALTARGTSPALVALVDLAMAEKDHPSRRAAAQAPHRRRERRRQHACAS